MKRLLSAMLLLCCSLSAVAIAGTINSITITVDTSGKGDDTRRACERDLLSHANTSDLWSQSESWAAKTHNLESLGAEGFAGQHVYSSRADDRADMLAINFRDDSQIKVVLLLVEKGGPVTDHLRSSLEDLLSILKTHYDAGAIKMINPVSPLIAD